MTTAPSTGISTSTAAVIIPMIRKLYPNLIAQSIVGVQPMTADTGNIFTIKGPVAKKSKYNFSRAKWYVATFNWNDFEEVYTWCTEQFGPEPPVARQDAWSRWTHKYGREIQFRDEKDYVWFCLRWS